MRWIWALALLPLAGCLDGAHDLSEDTYSLDARGLPEIAFPGQPFTFRLQIDGDLDAQSSHIGAHYWTDRTDDPSADFAFADACQHIEAPTDVPGAFDVTCTFAGPGTYHLRGHMRIEDGQRLDYWTTGHAVDVVDFQLASDVDEGSIAVGEPFLFNLTLSGSVATFSDHVGGHYWDAPVQDPTAAFSAKAGDCEHLTGIEVPGTYGIACTFQEAGEHHLRGHMRLASGDVQQDYWTSGMAITVT